MIAGLGRGPQWTLLIALSAVLATLLELVRLPAALLMGPLIAAILVATNGGTLRVARLPYNCAQALISCLIVRSITPSTLDVVASHAPIFAALVVAVLAASAALSWTLARMQVFPGTTAFWSCWPGGATAMVLMAEAYGADARLVAFMQYLRVAMVALAAPLVARLFADISGQIDIVWFPPIEWVPLAETVGLAASGVLIAQWLKIPAGGFTVPLVIGSILHPLGLIDIFLPPWLLVVAYALAGWNNGLGFTKQILGHVRRTLPQVFAAILLLMTICGFFAFLLVRYAGIDPLTAYLATSPGGADSVAIIAASTPVDVPFVVAMQTLRFFAVLFIGPHLARYMAKRGQRRSEEPPDGPLD
ncbi:AbrB family transcriptional regulator [Flaviflagellibacter deserti]|uniref:AbrB family transcriptional regulator n=1 Tax=Flaviflagellibacter deserti TaxID=2267266 RepID=A0ABV9Z362_9HYPH